MWGFDEILWFAHQDPAYRDTWLRYAFGWVKDHDPDGFLQMPTRRVLAAPTEGNVRMYAANRRSPACPAGSDVEQTIKDIWDDGEREAVE